MAAPDYSEKVTHGVRVSVNAFYLTEESSPKDEQFVFGYRVEITNESDQPFQVLARNWIIIDGDGERREVRGSGVVGQMPHLEPGESFTYTSYSLLPTTWGTMEGSYRIRRRDEEVLDVEIGRFWLMAEMSEASA